MSLLQEVAKHGLAYCEYNQALLSLQNLTQAQKIQIVRGLIKSLLQEVAKHGLAYCEYNHALISLQNLTNEQKIQIVKALIEDICAFKFEHYKIDL